MKIVPETFLRHGLLELHYWLPSHITVAQVLPGLQPRRYGLYRRATLLRYVDLIRNRDASQGSEDDFFGSSKRANCAHVSTKKDQLYTASDKLLSAPIPCTQACGVDFGNKKTPVPNPLSQ